MRTSELIRTMLENEHVTSWKETDKEIVFSYGSEPLVGVSKTRRCLMLTDYELFKNLPSEEAIKVLLPIHEYSFTPLEERDAEEFFLQHRWLSSAQGGDFLGYSEERGMFLTEHFYYEGRSKKEWEEVTNKTWDDLMKEFRTF